MEPIRIFISYAHANAIWLRKTVRDRAGAMEQNPKDLLTYWRNGLQFEGEVEFWYDRDEDEGLRGGDVWRKRIFDEIDRADVGVLLITQEFVDSGFIRHEELPRIVGRAERGEMELLPVLVEPAEWEELDLASFQLTPGRPTPLLQFLSEHEQHFKTAMLEVLKSLKAKVRRVRQRRDGASAAAKKEKTATPVARPSTDRDAAMSRMAPALNRWPIKRWALRLLGTAVLLVAAFAGMRAMLRSQGPPRVPESQPAPSLAPAPVAPLAPGVARVRMMRIPAGTFSMGSDKGEENEKPVHQVTLKSFEMDVTEVTVAEYQTCVRAGRCRQADWGGPCNSGVSPVLGREQHPINCVDWNQAKVYCESVGKRLPTEEEWEYAARGADGRTYPWGNSPPRNQLCWNGEGTDVGKGKRFATCPVGSYPSGDSPFGLHDMAGNVWEWTASEYCDSYGSGKNCTPARVFRGGSAWADSPQYVRAALRNEYETKKHGGHLGFRCARTL
jgi:formylglycine-generating enzyme required for sulfatase activity